MCRPDLDVNDSRQDRHLPMRVAPADVFGSPQSVQRSDGQPPSSPLRTEQLDVVQTPDLTEHIAELTQRGLDGLRPASPETSPNQQTRTSDVDAEQPQEPLTVLRKYKTRNEESHAALAHFGARKSLPRKQIAMIEPPAIEPIEEAASEDEAGSDDISEVDDHVQEETTHTKESNIPTTNHASQNTEMTNSPAPLPTQPGTAISRTRTFDYRVFRSSTTSKGNTLESPFRQRLTGGNQTPHHPKRRRPEIGVLRSQPLPSRKNDRPAPTDQQPLTEGGKDEYVTIGLLMKAQERERMLEETVSRSVSIRQVTMLKWTSPNRGNHWRQSERGSSSLR